MKEIKLTLSDENYQLWIDTICYNYNYQGDDEGKEVFAKQKFIDERKRNIKAYRKLKALEDIEIEDIEIT